jgi:hypothetical protein
MARIGTKAIASLTVFAAASCSSPVSKEEAALRVWAQQAEDGDRGRIQTLWSELEDDEATLRNELADVTPMSKDRRRYLIKSAQEMVALDKDSIRKAQEFGKLCADMIRSELGVYVHNRDYPGHRQTVRSDFRKSVCGGP